MEVQKSFKGQSEYGTLYLVPTPIGNLKDMTFRAIEVLNTVDLIAAEDTRNTGLLLKHFDIATKQMSFHEHNAFDKIPEILRLLKEGKSIAQVSDAGLPSISDPGHDLVKEAIKVSIPVVALPGASAGITGLIASGLAPQPHIFYGFLPRKSGQQKDFLRSKKEYPETQIFYESPYRVQETLEHLLEIYGDREVVLVRELTKVFEEYQRGCISELISYLDEHPAKGECLLIVSGFSPEAIELNDENLDIASLVRDEIEKGLKPNQAIKVIAKQYQLDRQDVYKSYHNIE
ncbi:16S rRNA (cytidine(1402)-2'-O)-methyltransferase [Streptococcus fryi]